MSIKISGQGFVDEELSCQWHPIVQRNSGSLPDSMQASSLQTCGQDVRTRIRLGCLTYRYRYGFESGNAFLINSTRGSASSATITSTTSKRKSISGFSSIRSHASAPREIRFCFARSTASSGRPKSSRVRVFTSINTSVSLSRHTTSISPPLRPRKLRKRIL